MPKASTKRKGSEVLTVTEESEESEKPRKKRARSNVGEDAFEDALEDAREDGGDAREDGEDALSFESEEVCATPAAWAGAYGVWRRRIRLRSRTPRPQKEPDVDVRACARAGVAVTRLAMSLSPEGALPAARSTMNTTTLGVAFSPQCLLGLGVGPAGGIMTRWTSTLRYVPFRRGRRDAG